MRYQVQQGIGNGGMIQGNAVQSRQRTEFQSMGDVFHLHHKAGDDEDEAIAVPLHDAAEDQGGEPRLADIKEKFGPRALSRILQRCCSCVTWLTRRSNPCGTRLHVERTPRIELDAVTSMWGKPLFFSGDNRVVKTNASESLVAIEACVSKGRILVSSECENRLVHVCRVKDVQ